MLKSEKKSFLRVLTSCFVMVLIVAIQVTTVFAGHTVLIQSDGPNNNIDAYTILKNYLGTGLDAPGYDQDLHVYETYADGINAFAMVNHAVGDYDGTNYDRQRNEIKINSSSADNLEAKEGQTFTYKWKFRVGEDFPKPTGFCHIFQLKATEGGEAGSPLLTFTISNGEDELLFRHARIGADMSTVRVLDSTPMSNIRGNWVEAEVTVLNKDAGHVTMTLKDVKTGALLMSCDEDADMWRRPEAKDADGKWYETDFPAVSGQLNRLKWGIYQALPSNRVLANDAIVLFADFQITNQSVDQGPVNTPTAPPAPTPAPTIAPPAQRPAGDAVVLQGDNLALGKRTGQSGYYKWNSGGYGAVNVVDGKSNTVWNAYQNTRSGWLMVDLGKDTDVNTFKMYLDNVLTFTEMSIYTVKDGEEYQPLPLAERYKSIPISASTANKQVTITDSAAATYKAIAGTYTLFDAATGDINAEVKKLNGDKASYKDIAKGDANATSPAGSTWQLAGQLTGSDINNTTGGLNEIALDQSENGRYIILYMKWSNGDAKLREFEIYNRQTVAPVIGDIAKGITPTVTTSTYAIDLGKPAVFDTIKIAETAGSITNYNVEYSNDGATWTQAVAGTKPATDTSTTIYLGEVVYGRYVRVNAPSVASISKIQVYGVPAVDYGRVAATAQGDGNGIAIALTNTSTFDKLEFSGMSTANYEVSVSEDNATWTSIQNGYKTPQGFYMQTPAKAKYIKVSGTAQTSVAASVYGYGSKAVTVDVNDPVAFANAMILALPGDDVVLPNGNLLDKKLRFESFGTQYAPVTFRPQTTGGVTLGGASSITVVGPNIVVDGFNFVGGQLGTGEAVVTLNSDYGRLTHTTIDNYNPQNYNSALYSWVKINGSYNKVDNNTFKKKRNIGPVITQAAQGSKYNVIVNNTFSDMPYEELSYNTNRAMIDIPGYNGADQADGAFALIEGNTFDNLSAGGIEVIALDSNNNIVRNNTLLGTKGAITVRGGNYNRILSNTIDGKNVPLTNGIVLSGKGNVIEGNTISNVALNGISLLAGEYGTTYPSDKLTESWAPYFKVGGTLVPRNNQVKDTVIRNNTITNPAGYGILIGKDYKLYWPSYQQVLLPENVAFIDNSITKNPGNIQKEAVYMPVIDKTAPLDRFNFVPNTFNGNTVDGGFVSVNGNTAVTGITMTNVPLFAAGTALTASNETVASVELTWDPAFVSPLVTAYRIYNEDQCIDTVTRERVYDSTTGFYSYKVSGLLPGTSYIFRVQAGDMAGNWTTNGPSVTAKTLADTTPPVIEGAATTLPNAKGWYNSDVTVRFTAADDGSGIASVTPDTTISTEGVSQSVEGTAMDKSGNAASVTVSGINIDKTAPEITVDMAEGAEFLLNRKVIINWTAVDTLSGVDTVGSDYTSGQPIDTATPGKKTITITAADNAGNQSSKTITYYVRYNYSGVLQPLNNDGTGVYKIGRTIPVKFQLKDADGKYISTAAAELYLVKPDGTEIKAQASGNSNIDNRFKYEGQDGQYMFTMTTKGLAAGNWKLKIVLGDGTTKFVQLTFN